MGWTDGLLLALGAPGDGGAPVWAIVLIVALAVGGFILALIRRK